MQKSNNIQNKTEEIEAFVKDMASQNRVIADTLKKYYLERGNMQDKARRLKISSAQFKINLNIARAWLKGRLSA